MSWADGITSSLAKSSISKRWSNNPDLASILKLSEYAATTVKQTHSQDTVSHYFDKVEDEEATRRFFRPVSRGGNEDLENLSEKYESYYRFGNVGAHIRSNRLNQLVDEVQAGVYGEDIYEDELPIIAEDWAKVRDREAWHGGFRSG